MWQFCASNGEIVSAARDLTLCSHSLARLRFVARSERFVDRASAAHRGSLRLQRSLTAVDDCTCVETLSALRGSPTPARHRRPHSPDAVRAQHAVVQRDESQDERGARSGSRGPTDVRRSACRRWSVRSRTAPLLIAIRTRSTTTSQCTLEWSERICRRRCGRAGFRVLVRTDATSAPARRSLVPFLARRRRSSTSDRAAHPLRRRRDRARAQAPTPRLPVHPPCHPAQAHSPAPPRRPKASSSICLKPIARLVRRVHSTGPRSCRSLCSARRVL